MSLINFFIKTISNEEYNSPLNFQYPQKIKSGLSLGEISLPALHPELDTSSKRVSKPAAQVKVKPAKPVEPAKEFPDINDYLIHRKRDASPEELKGHNLGSLCESRPKNVINFSSCKLDRTQSTIDKIQPNVVREPMIKKRKIKMDPIRINYDADVASTAAQNLPKSTDDKSELGKIYLSQVRSFGQKCQNTYQEILSFLSLL